MAVLSFVIPSSIGFFLSWQIALKSFTVLLGASAITLLLKRQPASVRHLIWFLSLVGIILLPIFELLVPELPLPLVPSNLTKFIPETPRTTKPVILDEPVLSSVRSQLATEAVAAPDLPASQPSLADTIPTIAETKSSESQSRHIDWLAIEQLIWLSGTAAVLLPLLVGTFSVWRIGKDCRLLVSGATTDLVVELCGRLGIGKAVRVLQTSRTTMPVTWGFYRNTILLPETFTSWSEERQRFVLLHELAHVKRRDCCTQLIAWVICAIFWFNPLAWLALRRMRVERERACDDIVLSQKMQASDYASHLLEIARLFKSSIPASMAAIAMAKPTQLEGRLLAILEAKPDRASLTRGKALCIATTVGVVMLSLAACKITGSSLRSRSTPSQYAPKFVRAKSYMAGVGAGDATEGDLNGDGRADLLVMNFATNTLSLYQNLSSPSSQFVQLGERIDLQVGDMPLHAKLADIDQDGKLDVVVSSHGGDFLSIFRNINTSGKLDKNSFAPPVLLMTQRAPHFLDAADFNRDGKVDLVVANNGHGRGNSISIFENVSSPGKIAFAERVDVTTGQQPVCVVASDIDGDGWPDLVVGNHLSKTLSILPNLNRGEKITAFSFSQKLDLQTGTAASVIVMADLDVDGKTDIALSYNTAGAGAPCMVSLYRNLSTPAQVRFEPRIDLPVGSSGAVGIAVSDINEDGWPDLFVGHHYGEGISMFLNTGDQNGISVNSFANSIELNTGPFGGLHFVDLDGDKHKELVAPERSASAFSIYKAF